MHYLGSYWTSDYFFFDKRISANPNFHQFNISINTDYKSEFSTSISNEYGYLAFYLEKARNAAEEPLYSRFDIFEWLYAIRRNGNEQSFIGDDFWFMINKQPFISSLFISVNWKK